MRIIEVTDAIDVVGPQLRTSDELAFEDAPPRAATQAVRSTFLSASADPPFATGSIDRDQWARYEPRMRRVIAHLYDHLDAPLDLNALSDIACMSPHHWHRVYHAMVGETLARTVKRLRLHRAAGQLACTAMAVSDVAAAAGYPNVASFTRTFKSVYGLPPSRFRSAGQHREFELRSATHAAPAFEVSVRDLDALPVLAVAHQGSYMAIGRAFDLLFSRVAAAGLARPGMRTLALFFDDPGLVPEASLRAQAAVAGCSAPAAECELLRTTIPAGAYAVLAHTGPYASMKAAYRWLFGDWLAHSGFEPAIGPVVEEYLNSPRETAPRNLRTRIHLPLRPLRPLRPEEVEP
jgi:AraC family transcriptional regulator